MSMSTQFCKFAGPHGDGMSSSTAIVFRTVDAAKAILGKDYNSTVKLAFNEQQQLVFTGVFEGMRVPGKRKWSSYLFAGSAV